MRPKGRQASREERALWRHAMRDVTPMAPQASPEPAPAPIEVPPLAAPATPVIAGPLPALAPAAAPGLDRRSAERLRRGQLPIAARLDLHGMTQEEAHRALDGFLARAYDLGQRCVLVITGKGFRRGLETREGVLRAAVPRWLNEAPNRARILAFTTATPRDGGGGALYVLIRRRR
jgi:DNA-nicking Smr family endonuclease